jgi:hypothetical protein
MSTRHYVPGYVVFSTPLYIIPQLLEITACTFLHLHCVEHTELLIIKFWNIFLHKRCVRFSIPVEEQEIRAVFKPLQAHRVERGKINKLVLCLTYYSFAYEGLYKIMTERGSIWSSFKFRAVRFTTSVLRSTYRLLWMAQFWSVFSFQNTNILRTQIITLKFDVLE